MLRRSLIIATLALATFALGPMFDDSDDAEAQGPPVGWSLPPQAREVAPNVWFIGTSVSDGVAVEGFAFIHPAVGHAKPTGSPGGGKGKDKPKDDGDPTPDASSCYSFIANGAVWRSLEDYRFDLTGAPAGATADLFSGAFETWEAAAGTQIVGSGTSSGTEAALVLNESNDVFFGDIVDAGTLGVTVVWYTRGGRPSSRRIVEADIMIDTDDGWNWQLVAAGGQMATGAFDLKGVVVHEVGHYVGLGHTDTTTLCAAETMYPSIAAEDSSRQSLGVGDRAGIKRLY